MSHSPGSCKPSAAGQPAHLPAALSRSAPCRPAPRWPDQHAPTHPPTPQQPAHLPAALSRSAPCRPAPRWPECSWAAQSWGPTPRHAPSLRKGRVGQGRRAGSGMSGRRTLQANRRPSNMQKLAGCAGCVPGPKHASHPPVWPVSVAPSCCHCRACSLNIQTCARGTWRPQRQRVWRDLAQRQAPMVPLPLPAAHADTGLAAPAPATAPPGF